MLVDNKIKCIVGECLFQEMNRLASTAKSVMSVALIVCGKMYQKSSRLKPTNHGTYDSYQLFWNKCMVRCKEIMKVEKEMQ